MTARDIARAVPAVALGASGGVLAATSPRLGLTVAALAAGLVAAALMLVRRTFDRLTALMLIALPLQSAFVIDFGITIRLSYIFGALALAMAAIAGHLRLIRHPAMYWLVAFLLVVVLSISLTPLAPALSFTASGMRGMFGIRPFVQCLQLALMVGCMVLTYSYCRTRKRLDFATTLILAGGLFSLAYGIYGFVAPLTGIRYVEINNAMNTDWGYGYKEQGNSFAGGYIPRPRSTFMEPLNFGNFLILVIGLLALKIRNAAAIGSTKARAIWGLVIIVTIGLFVIGVNSRGAIYGSVAAAMSLVIFVRQPKQLLRSARAVAPWLLLLITLAGLFIQFRYKGGIPVFAGYFADRFNSAVGASSRVKVDWNLVWPLIVEHPILGIGFGNMPFYWPSLEGMVSKGVTESVNLYLKLLGDVGIVGLSLWLGFLATILLALLRAGRHRTTLPDMRAYCIVLFFIIVADAVQRISTVGIATDVHMWVEFALALAVIRLIEIDRQRRTLPA